MCLHIHQGRRGLIFSISFPVEMGNRRSVTLPSLGGAHQGREPLGEQKNQSRRPSPWAMQVGVSRSPISPSPPSPLSTSDGDRTSQSEQFPVRHAPPSLSERWWISVPDEVSVPIWCRRWTRVVSGCYYLLVVGCSCYCVLSTSPCRGRVGVSMAAPLPVSVSTFKRY
jgi:hypothetical protein